jgi:ketosteroid isomerase-like protein
MRDTAVAILLTLLFSLSAWADGTTDEEAVWQLEENYWLYVKGNDLASYRALWDERFVGWPGFSDQPLGKENIGTWIAALHANPAEIYDYQLTRKAVRSFGDVVVVHYQVEDFVRSADSGEIIRQRDNYRITHTWQRRGNSWQIITGMSGMQASKSN